MKLQYKPTSINSLNSIFINRTQQPHMGGNWHFHEEYEIIYFLKGEGMRIVGDHISHFREGELVLVGESLPHLWRNELSAEGTAYADYIVIKFFKNLGGVDLFSIPEFIKIRRLLIKSAQGILFSQKNLDKIASILIQLTESSSSDAVINLLRVLEILSREEEIQLLSSKSFSFPVGNVEGEKIQNVINFISANYDQAISLEDISKVACMTPPSFCRFFKNSTQKTFSHFLNEVRVSKTCQLLINGEQSINQICFQVGFNSLTNFNRTFRFFKNLTPTEYRDKFSSIRQLEKLGV